MSHLFKRKTKRNTSRSRVFLILRLIFVIIITLSIIGTVFYFNNQNNPSSGEVLGDQAQKIDSETVQPDKYWEFTGEIYDLIKENYWNKIDHPTLLNIYELAAEKITGTNQNIVFKEKNGLKIMFSDVTETMDDTQKKEFTVQLSTIVLANLEPFGRSGLFSEKQKQELINTVSNIDPNTDLYQSIGADTSSSPEDIEQKYTATKKELENILSNPNSSAEEKDTATKKLALADRAMETLGNQADRNLYNQNKIESTVSADVISPQILHLHIKKISPSSFQDFQNTVKQIDIDYPKLNTLILDLRGNIGGSVDLMQWFLGPFIGPGNLAYEFYHQGESTPYKTQTGWMNSLTRYKKVIVLTDSTMQSSAEVMAAALKKYNVGVLVGTTTKGWGTIEKIFPLKNQIDDNETYSMYLVHSITMRDDNQPIEGRGVDPHININDTDWEEKLNEYYNYPPLIAAIKQVW